MKKVSIVFFIIIIGVMLFFSAKQANKIVDIGDNAYYFQLEDVNGNVYNLADYEGKVIVLNFFTTWCDPCIIEGPELEEFNNKYNDLATLFIINRGESKEQVKDYLDLYDYQAKYLLDYDLNVSKSYKITGQPETIIIGKDGIIKEHIKGEITNEILLEKVQKYQ